MDLSRFDARRFDANEAVRLSQRHEGQLALSEFPRLLEGLPESQPGSVAWSVQGERGPLGQAWLRLALRAEPRVVCQRCLQPFALPVESEVVLELVASEAELETDDDPADEDPEVRLPEKVLCRSRLDLCEQLEDELILSVPYITRHEVCPEPLRVVGGQAEQGEPEGNGRRRPFAALAGLKPVVRREDGDE